MSAAGVEGSIPSGHTYFNLESVMTTSERQAVLRFNRRRLFLNRMIMRKRAFISSIRKALQSQGTASIGSL